MPIAAAFGKADGYSRGAGQRHADTSSGFLAARCREAAISFRQAAGKDLDRWLTPTSDQGFRSDAPVRVRGCFLGHLMPRLA